MISQVLLNSFAFELVLLCLFYTPPPPAHDGAPMMTINIVGIVLGGTFAALITIPTMLSFAWLYEPIIFVRLGRWLARTALQLLLCVPCWRRYTKRGRLARKALAVAASDARPTVARRPGRFGCARRSQPATTGTATSDGASSRASEPCEGETRRSGQAHGDAPHSEAHGEAHGEDLEHLEQAEAFAAIDTDGDGILSSAELDRVADLLDGDGDGVVTRDELAGMVGGVLVLDDATGGWMASPRPAPTSLARRGVPPKRTDGWPPLPASPPPSPPAVSPPTVRPGLTGRALLLSLWPSPPPSPPAVPPPSRPPPTRPAVPSAPPAPPAPAPSLLARVSRIKASMRGLSTRAEYAITRSRVRSASSEPQHMPQHLSATHRCAGVSTDVAAITAPPHLPQPRSHLPQPRPHLPSRPPPARQPPELIQEHAPSYPLAPSRAPSYPLACPSAASAQPSPLDPPRPEPSVGSRPMHACMHPCMHASALGPGRPEPSVGAVGQIVTRARRWRARGHHRQSATPPPPKPRTFSYESLNEVLLKASLTQSCARQDPNHPCTAPHTAERAPC